MVTLEDKREACNPTGVAFLRAQKGKKTKASLYSQGNIICDYKYFMGKESTGCGHGGVVGYKLDLPLQSDRMAGRATRLGLFWAVYSKGLRHRQ